MGAASPLIVCAASPLFVRVLGVSFLLCVGRPTTCTKASVSPSASVRLVGRPCICGAFACSAVLRCCRRPVSRRLTHSAYSLPFPILPPAACTTTFLSSVPVHRLCHLRVGGRRWSWRWAHSHRVCGDFLFFSCLCAPMISSSLFSLRSSFGYLG